MKGCINVVGIGSGNLENMTFKAFHALEEADVIVGYITYINQIKKLLPDKKFEFNGMKKEVERCQRCIELAKEGKNVAIISSGDAGVYGMAGLILELAENDIEVKISCGVTSCIEAAAVLGAPLMNDYVVISMSDLMTPYETIMNRVECACHGNMVICIYNPRSKGRKEHLENAFEIIRNIQGDDTIVGVVKNAGRDNEESFITTIRDFDYEKIDMSSMVIVGNGDTFIKGGKMITKRGYQA